MIKTRQSAREKLDSYYKKSNCFTSTIEHCTGYDIEILGTVCGMWYDVTAYHDKTTHRVWYSLSEYLTMHLAMYVRYPTAHDAITILFGIPHF